MSSQRQIEANRLNAQRSTGPRTDAGKSASSMNALKSGIHAESQVIIGESADALINLTAEYHSRYHPTTPEQRALVDTLISSEWLLRRLRQAEAQIWNNGLQFLEESEYQDKRHPIGDTFANRQETMARLQRRIDSTDRAFHRALRVLRQLQSETVEPADTAPQARPQLIALELPSPEIGFVPSSSATPRIFTPPRDRGTISCPPSWGKGKSL